MSTLSVPDLEMGLTGDVHQAAHTFAVVLAATPAFQAFEQAHDALRRDDAAQRAGAAYQAKQQELQALVMLGAVSVEEQAALDYLREAFLSAPSVAAMLQAQEVLQALCRAAADMLSAQIDLDVAAACGPRCCA